MTDLQLNLFLKTAELGSISAAASALKIPQSNASSCLRSLEQELGITIFIRSRKGISLTEKGAEVLSHAKKIAFESNEISAICSGNHTRLRISHSGLSEVDKVFSVFCRKNSGIKHTDLSCECCSLFSSLKKLYSSDIDLSIAPFITTTDNPLPNLPSGFKTLCLGTYPLFILTSNNHLPGSRDILNLGETANEILYSKPYICFNRDLHPSSPCSSSFFSSDTEVIETCSESTALDIITSLGYTLSISQSENEAEETSLTSIRVPNARLELYAITLNQIIPGSSTDCFVSLLSESLASYRLPSEAELSSQKQQLINRINDNSAAVAVLSPWGETAEGNGKTILPLVNLIRSHPSLFPNSFIADKVVGRGAASLYIKCGVTEVYAKLISLSALEMLKKHGIKCSFDIAVPVILNHSETDECPLEKRVKNTDNVDAMVQIVTVFTHTLTH